MRLSIECQAVLMRLTSSTLAVQLRQHHNIQHPTVESNSRSRCLIETLRFKSNRFKDQNFLHDVAMRWSISTRVVSFIATTVPSTSRCKQKPETIGTSPRRAQSVRFVCALHFEGCKSSPLLLRAPRSIANIRFKDSQHTLQRVMSSAKATCVNRWPSSFCPTLLP